MAEILLSSVFGNQFKITVNNDEGLFPQPENCVTLQFDGKGIVLDKEELKKLKSFLNSLSE
jgi:hypothetical protein